MQLQNNQKSIVDQSVRLALVEEQINYQSIDTDPFAPSYLDSGIQYISYRIGIGAFAISMIILGRSNLPSDQVDCIQDIVIDWLQPITNFYTSYPGFGLTLVSIMQLIVDIQLVLMLTYWFWRGKSMRYPLSLAILGISKVFLNILFQSRPITNNFTDQAFPSIIFGANFANTYFFSGVTCLMLLNLLQLYKLDLKRLYEVQIVLLIYVMFVLMTTRQNYFMDVITALVFSHYVFYFIQDRLDIIDGFFFKLQDRVASRKQPNEEKFRTQVKDGLCG